MRFRALINYHDRQQGNATISFEDVGSGKAVVRQETSYYAFGLTIPGSAVTTPSSPNKNLYNGGAEWQNDYGDLPDLQQTFYRNYDAALGAWTGVDPMAEYAESMSSYHYAGNNPVMRNDPLGNLSQAQWDFVVSQFENGIDGNYHAEDGGDGVTQVSGNEAFVYASIAITQSGGWGNTVAGNLETAYNNYANGMTATAGNQINNTRGFALYLYEDGSLGTSTGSKNDYISTQSYNGTNYSWDFTQISYDSSNANQGGDGPLTASSLMSHYLGNSGTTYNLSQNEFNTFLNTMQSSGELDKIRNKGIPVPNVKGLYQVTVNTYGTSYERAVGLATLYYNNTGIVGYSDWWNFDPKPWGTRSISGEALTRLAHSLQPWGVPFYVIGGITPPINTIPKN